MKIYLSGKITGDRDYRRKFGNMAKKLEGFGHAVFNPGVMPDGFDYEDYMKIDFTALAACDAIYLMDDWKISPGAIREKEEAVRLGLKKLSEKDFILRMTLIKLCDDMDMLQKYASENDAADALDYYFKMNCITSYVRNRTSEFDENVSEEENFCRMYDDMNDSLKELFYTDFISEGYIQLEYDIDEEKPEGLEKHFYERMVEASKKMCSLLEDHIAQKILQTA